MKPEKPFPQVMEFFDLTYRQTSPTRLLVMNPLHRIPDALLFSDAP